MFPRLHSTTHVFLIASAVAATVLLIATRGRLGYDPERAESEQAGYEPAVRELAGPGAPRA
jgi:hypothetical protein